MKKVDYSGQNEGAVDKATGFGEHGGWEERAKSVVGWMRVAQEKVEKEYKSRSKEERQAEPIQNVLDITDYLYVLKSFSITGYVKGVEAIVREVEKCPPAMPPASSLPSPSSFASTSATASSSSSQIPDPEKERQRFMMKLSELRLVTLMKWLDIRRTIYQRYTSHSSAHLQTQYQSTSTSTGAPDVNLKSYKHIFGLRQKTAADLTPPFFPEGMVKLLVEILRSIRTPTLNTSDSNSSPAASTSTLSLYEKRTLDLLLRIAKETKNETAFETILRNGYGVELKWPDVEPGVVASLAGRKGKGKRLHSVKQEGREDEDEDINWMGTEAEAAPSPGWMGRTITPEVKGEEEVRLDRHALNTVLAKYAEEGELWMMVQAFEVLGKPLERGNVDVESMYLPEEEVAEVEAEVESNTHRRVKKVTKGLQEEEDMTEREEEPPITLTEAIKREQESGQRLSFFGRTIPPEVDIEAPSIEQKERIPFPIRPASTFLHRQPTPRQVEAHIMAHNLSPEEFEDVAAVRYSDEGENLNTSTFEMIIKACAVEAGVSRTYEDQQKAVELGIHFLRFGVREMTRRHNDFLEAWVRIAKLHKELLEWAEKDGSIAGTPDERTSARMAVDMIKAQETRAVLRARMDFPRIYINAAMVTPLYQAMRSLNNTYIPSKMQSWNARRIREVDEEVRKVQAYYRDEWEILTGRSWDTGERITGTSTSTAITTSTVAAAALEEGVSSPSPSTVSMTAPSETSISLPPSFFTSSLASHLDLNWLGTLPRGSFWRRLTHEHNTSANKFTLGNHLKVLRRGIEGMHEITITQAEITARHKKRRRWQTPLTDKGTAS